MQSADETNPFPERRQKRKKCPICWDSVYVSETRPVRFFTGQEGDPPQEGGDVVLRLIGRQPGSTLALPRDGAIQLEVGEDIPWYLAAEVMDYARIMKGGEDYMVTEYDREVEELEQQEREDELIFGEETHWTQKAIAAIFDLKGRLRGLGNPPVIPALPVERRSGHAPLKFHDGHADSPSALIRSRLSDQFGSMAAEPPNNSSHLISSATPPLVSRRMSPPPNERLALRTSIMNGGGTVSPHDRLPFFFYEALRHFYLSPLDIRILRTAFGVFSCFPSTILPRIERVSTGHIVDDELRRRAKYLAHLPRGCEVAFLECDWTDVVGPDVLTGFASEIEGRRKRNREKEAREEKARIRAEKEEDDKRWAAARRRRPALPSETFTEAQIEPLTLREGVEPVSSSVDSDFTLSSPPWPSSGARAGSAFASLASPSTSPVAPRTVWGTTAVAPSSPVLAPICQEPRSTEHDGWLQDWERDLLRDDELAVQLEASSIGDNRPNAVPTAMGNKKKKGKKITLMSTTVRRGA
ncbi:MAG: hypothetical protein Q9184_002406 [Pyrenodesmia sp. 2 TL-2023]